METQYLLEKAILNFVLLMQIVTINADGDIVNDYSITYVSTKGIKTDDMEDANCAGNSQIIRHNLERKLEFHYEQDDLAESKTDEDEEIFYDTGEIHPMGVDDYVQENRVIISNLTF